MFQAGYMEKLNTIMEWITRFFALQLIWILFCLVGLGIGGIFPATFTMFAICRKWINKQTEVPIFKTFWELYRKGFLKTNLLGWVTTLTGCSIYYYFQLFKGSESMMDMVLFIAVWIAGILYLMTVLLMIPVYVHFDIKLFSVAKHALIIAIAHPFHTASIAALTVGFSMVIILIPGLFPFFSFSLLAFGVMWIANSAFTKMEQKVSKFRQTNSSV
ncbi:YesL family protein [Fredinandcohnia sp. FSL W7-1320]|uniref:YesL family protein n=1 Tax=Fredinandcohnia sp. FSL W7-1320 TaxID=2954540 RepID=UPI0030FD54A0